MALDEEIVKYIFEGVHPKIAIGEDGYIVYDFDATYPANLAVFVPIEVQPSNYSNFFPKSFEDYFRDLDLEISRLSLLIEQGNIFNRFPKTEYIMGQFLNMSTSEYTVFRFDELLETREKTMLLCRTKVKDTSVVWITQILTTSAGLFPVRVWTVDGVEYIYWGLSFESLFCCQKEVMDAWTPAMLESLCR